MEAERLAQQLRGRFLLRLWRGAARRQREERALLRLAACSVAGSLPRSPAAALAAADSTLPTQLKVSARHCGSAVWSRPLQVVLSCSIRGNRHNTCKDCEPSYPRGRCAAIDSLSMWSRAVCTSAETSSGWLVTGPGSEEQAGASGRGGLASCGCRGGHGARPRRRQPRRPGAAGEAGGRDAAAADDQ